MYGITKFVVGCLILLITLGIISKLFTIEIIDCNKKNNIFLKILCAIKNIIFFIPCLITILVEDINNDIKATPKSIYLLFFIELVLVCLFFFLPVLFKFITNINKNNLLEDKGTVYLDKQIEVGSYQKLDKNYKKPYKFSLLNNDQPFNMQITSKNISTKYEYNYSYSISFYLYLNPQPINTSIAYNKESELFNYANKPVILYDGRNRTLLIKSRTLNNEGTQMDTIYKTKNIKYQKWLYFVINYDNNMIDVFIDGELVGSKKNVPPFFKENKITIGEDNGIHGSIKDLYYFDRPRPINNIEFLHDLTKNKQ